MLEKDLAANEVNTFKAGSGDHRLILAGDFGGGTFTLKENRPGLGRYQTIPGFEWGADISKTLPLLAGREYQWELAGATSPSLTAIIEPMGPRG